jgi:hypothetical protein
MSNYLILCCKLVFYTLDDLILFPPYVVRFYRHQNPEQRLSFPDVVDELLDIEKSLPASRNTEVGSNYVAPLFIVGLLFREGPNLSVLVL